MKFIEKLGLFVSLLISSSAWADLTGTQVTGSLQFNVPAAGPNYYDPANGFVAGFGGSLNSAGTTVAISSTATEFGFADSANVDSADFTGSQLTITDNELGGGANPWTMTFTDPAFTSLSEASDDFINGGLTGVLAGDVITVTWQGDLGANNSLQQAVFNVNGAVNNAPDNTVTLGLLSLALLSMAALKRFKHSLV